MIGVQEAVATAAIPDPGNDGKVLKAFYDAGKKCFWVENSRGGWIEFNEQSLKRLLRIEGHRSKRLEGEPVSPLDAKITEIQLTHDVAYAGPLAGHQSGVIESFGNRILVTSGPKLIEPAPGQWPVLASILEQLLCDADFDQRSYVYGWLKFALEALCAGSRRPGPVLVLAGPRNCGKSLLQNIFTVLLGGRVAKPYRYMRGGTEFNSELFGSEHLMIEDETPSTDLRARRNLGANIKAFTVNEAQSCHAKGRSAITLAPFWRVSISVNDEPENLMILPPVSDSEQDSLADKMIMLRARNVIMPMPSETLDERNAFWGTLIAELPAFVHDLQTWIVPDELRHGRYGIRTWQHPKLLAALGELAPETRLLTLMDEVIFGQTDSEGMVITVPRISWTGTAEQLERILRESVFGAEAQRLFSWPTAAGTYLGRLALKHPDRVQDARTSYARNWLLRRAKPPAAEQAVAA